MERKEIIKRVAAVAVCAAVCIGYTVAVGTSKINVVIKLGDGQTQTQTAADEQNAAPEQTTVSAQTENTAQNESTTAAQTEQTSTSPEQTQTSDKTDTQKKEDNTRPAQAQKATEKETAAQTQAPASEKSKEETVELYNRAVNKVKKEATQITRNYKHLEIPEDTLELPGAIQSLGKTAIGAFVKPDDTPQVWTTKEDYELGFPVSGTDYSSKMTSSMVKSAVCTDGGDVWNIEIVLFDDTITSPVKGEGYAGVFSTTTAATFQDISIPTVTFNEVRINGINGSVKCSVDKKTERVTSITFANTDVMYLNVKVAFSVLEAKMSMVCEENFDVKY